MINWNRTARLMTVLTLVALVGFIQKANAQPMYAVANIDADLGAPGLSDVTDINENGDAVGSAFVGTGFLPFVYNFEHGGRFLPLIGTNPEAVPVAVTDRDANGDILIAATVGELGLDVVWTGASMAYYRVSTATGQVIESVEVTELPGFAQAFAVDINNAGKIVGYSRAAGASPFEPTVYDIATGAVSLFTFPATPAAINNSDQVAGGTFIGNLNGAPTDIGTPSGTIGASITGLNDAGEICAGILQPFTDGNGRRVRGAALYFGAWDIIWSNSAFDTASGINENGDIVGALGVGAAIREAVYFRAENQIHFINDLFAPTNPFFVDGVADINTNRQIGTAIPAALLTPLGTMIIPGDVNGDARVAADDLCAWLNSPIDLDGDGDVDADDEQWLINRLGDLGIVVDDCNANGTPDACDILAGRSNDCNANGIPDECEPDCDADGLPDECESDCNDNGAPDDCDVANGVSDDCNGNGIPDECDGSETVAGVVTYGPPQLLIEDSTFTDTVFISDVGVVADVEFAVDLNFRIGEITLKLHHAGVTAVLIDQPGHSPSNPFGFSNLGYDVILDDQGTGPNIQTVGALFGEFESITSPPTYKPNQALSMFDGLPRDGAWTIEVITGFPQTFDPKITSWSVAVTDEAAPAGVCGDIDGNSVVDSSDYAHFAACTSGPGVFTPPPGCDPADFDASDFNADGEVDAVDFAMFQVFFGG